MISSPPATRGPDAGSPEEDPVPSGGSVARIAGLTRSGASVIRELSLRMKVALVVVVALVIGGGIWWQTTRNDLPEGAAFSVGDQVVTSQAVQRRIATLKALYGVKVPTTGTKHDTFEQDAAKSMAVQIILQDEAEKKGIVVPTDQVTAVLNRLIMERYTDGGRAAFIAALGQLGATEDQVRQEISSQLLVSKLFDSVVKGVTVTDDEVRTAFLDRRADLGAPVRRDLRNIVVSDRVTAERVAAVLRRGTSFATAASQYSLDGSTRDHGGELGVVGASDLEPAYAKAAFGTPIGEVFGPVKTQYGWNVGMATRQVAAQPAIFAKVRDALKKTLLGEKSLKEWRAWLAGVIKDHHVVYADAFRPADPDSVPDVDQAAVEGTAPSQ